MMSQTSLFGKPVEVTRDVLNIICCSPCYNAKEKECVCKCNGAFHGLGLQQTREEDPVLPEALRVEFEKQVRDNDCNWCKTDLTNLPIHYYPHEGGWTVEGLGTMWLYKQCPKCTYCWNIGKLGVNRT